MERLLIYHPSNHIVIENLPSSSGEDDGREKDLRGYRRWLFECQEDR